MQHAKDSFLLALRDRLAAFAPDRTIVVDGEARPAVLSAEYEVPSCAPPAANTFLLLWGGCSMCPADADLRRLECTILYRTSGETANTRGRDLARRDRELANICAPPRVAKRDHTQTPARALGSTVFWTEPQLEAPEDRGSELLRRARIIVFFTPEVES